jgi:GNAT superfamily N-acetyltransferase
MASDNHSITFETYTNPYSDDPFRDIVPEAYGDFIFREQMARSEAGIDQFPKDFSNDETRFNEAILREYPFSLTKSPELSDWHDKATNWMPSDAEGWWLEQFKNNEALNPMSREWWRLRARSFHVARDSDDGNRPVGALAVTKIYLSERFAEMSRTGSGRAALYEPRAHVVAESYQGRGIGTGLWRTALRSITMSEDPLPTVVLTTNEIEAKLLQKEGGTNKPSFGDLPARMRQVEILNNRLVCWARLESTPRYCDACPIKHNTAWWFPTHRRPAPEEQVTETKP